jgi:hypothetical protein
MLAFRRECVDKPFLNKTSLRGDLDKAAIPSFRTCSCADIPIIVITFNPPQDYLTTIANFLGACIDFHIFGYE